MIYDNIGDYSYRGYRYDTETGLYYLQSRYYNPEWGRFINADGLIGQTGELLGHNLFAYCKNNPVNRKDESGFVSSHVSYDIGEGAYISLPKRVNTPSIYDISTKKPSNQNAIKAIANESAKGAALGVSEKALGDAIVGHERIKWGNMPIPKVLADYEIFGDTFMVAGVISLIWGIQDNFSGMYSPVIAWERTLLDLGSLALTTAFFGGGGWIAVGGAVLVGVATEAAKYYISKDQPALKPKY